MPVTDQEYLEDRDEFPPEQRRDRPPLFIDTSPLLLEGEADTAPWDANHYSELLWRVQNRSLDSGQSVGRRKCIGYGHASKPGHATLQFPAKRSNTVANMRYSYPLPRAFAMQPS